MILDIQFKLGIFLLMETSLYIDTELAKEAYSLSALLTFVADHERTTVGMANIRELQDKIDALRQSLMERTNGTV